MKIRNEKELLSVLGDQKGELSKYISLNKLDIKDVEDMSRIVSYYNGL